MCIKTLQDLLDRPFDKHIAQDQASIVNRGRFTDPIDMRQDKNKTRTLQTTWYQKVKWLTSNTVNNKLYCWTCVLFPWPSSQGKLWWQGGFDDLKNLTSAVKKHEISTEHNYSTVKYKVFVKRTFAQIENATVKPATNSHIAQKNIDYLKRVIDLTTYVVKLRLPLLPKEVQDIHFDPYKGLMNILKKYDTITHSLDLTVNPSADNLFQVGIAKSMVDVLRQHIAEEINQCHFFSCVVDEVPNVSGCKKIAISVRFIKDGNILERFIGIFNVEKPNANDVYEILNKALTKFDYKNKLISQSYDGGVVPSIDLFSLQKNVKKAQTEEIAQLVPCYSQDFCNVILPQALRSIKECKTFFATINSIKLFFKECSGSVTNFNIFATLANSIYSTIEIVSKNKDSLITLLNLEIRTDKYDNNPHLLAQMNNILLSLTSPKFINCLVFIRLLYQTIEEHIDKMRTSIFNTKTCYKIALDMAKRVKITLKELDATYIVADFNYQLFKENVLKIAEYEIEGRFLDMDQLDFFYLIHTGKKNFAGVCWTCLTELFGPKFFNLQKLKSELEMYYYDPSICGPNLNLPEMIASMYSTEVYIHLPELYKYFCLLATIPSFYVPKLNSPSERVRLYSSNLKHLETKLDSDIALLVLEKDLFEFMEKDKKWPDNIIQRFMNNINLSPYTPTNYLDHPNSAKSEVIVEKVLYPQQIIGANNLVMKDEDIDISEVKIEVEHS